MNTLTLFREEQIQRILYEMGSNFYEIEHRKEVAGFNDPNNQDIDYMMQTDFLEDNFVSNAKNVFKLICSYIESSGELHYLIHFKEVLKPMLSNRKEILSSKFHQESGDTYSEVLNEFWSFLRTYEFFGEDNYDYLLKRTGITYLENILKNTAVILEDLGKVPKSETEVYNNVKVVCKSVFPNAKYPITSFVTSAQEYKPDILLPFLNVAIEYKYARTEAKLKTTIDQIFADVSGYSNNKDYKIFYAVFYVTNDFWGVTRFNEIWKEKSFPKNWIGIYVVGK